MVNTRTGRGRDTPARARSASTTRGTEDRARARSRSPTQQRRRRRSAPSRSRPARPTDCRVSQTPQTTLAAAGGSTDTTLTSQNDSTAPRPERPPNLYGNWDFVSDPYAPYTLPPRGQVTRRPYTQPQVASSPWSQAAAYVPQATNDPHYWQSGHTQCVPLYSQATTPTYNHTTASNPPYAPAPSTHEFYSTPQTTYAPPTRTQQLPAATAQPAAHTGPTAQEPEAAPAATGAPGEHALDYYQNQWLSPLAHTTLPLSANIPLTTKNKIWQHQFVDLHTLLNKTDTSKRLKLELDPSGTFVTCSPPQENKNPLSIEKWTSAFIIFSAIYLERFTPQFPNKALELLQYSDTIRYAAFTYGGRGWAMYDEHTRKTWTSPLVPFHQMQGEFWLKFITSRPNPLPTNHMQSRLCFDFNKGTCTRSACIFQHACSSCGSSKHSASARLCSTTTKNNSLAWTHRQPFRPRPPFRPNTFKPQPPWRSPRPAPQTHQS